MTLTYASVRLRPVSVPLRRKVVSRVGCYERWPLILVDLHTKEGVTGLAYLEPYLADAWRSIVPAIETLFALRAGRPVRPLDDFRAGRKALNLVGYGGVAMIANAALDMAAWDALAKAAGLPLAAMLGGAPGPVPAYNSNGLWLTDPATLAEEAASLIAEGGFTALKIRLGRARLADDRAAIRAAREAGGDDIALMADFNQGLTFGDALRRCHALDDDGLYWFEEPTIYSNLEGHARLARELRTPLQLGENFYGPRDLHTAIAMGACDSVMPDLMRIGGISGWLASAPIAAAAGIEVSSHLYPEVSAHLLRVTETAHWLEWQDWADPILAEPFPLADGMLTVPDRPGCGLAWDEAAVARYAVG